MGEVERLEAHNKYLNHMLDSCRDEMDAKDAQLDAMTAERDEWKRRARVAQEAQIARGDVFSDTNPEAQHLEDCENACPACGGSGHKDDAAGYAAERDALVGAAYVAARLCAIKMAYDGDHAVANAIRALTPAHAITALDHIRAQAKAEGMRKAWPHVRKVICSQDWTDCDGDVFCEAIRDAILAAAEKEAGK